MRDELHTGHTPGTTPHTTPTKNHPSHQENVGLIKPCGLDYEKENEKEGKEEEREIQVVEGSF
jgi:hypothetical protein